MDLLDEEIDFEVDEEAIKKADEEFNKQLEIFVREIVRDEILKLENE